LIARNFKSKFFAALVIIFKFLHNYFDDPELFSNLFKFLDT